jgi:hypothetical protein
MLSHRVASRYLTSLDVRGKLRDFERSRRVIEQALSQEDVDKAEGLFVELGRDLDPLATLLKDVVIQRSDEQRKIKNVKQWLRRLTYPFDPKNLVGDSQDKAAWMRLGLETVEEALKSLSRVQERLEGYSQVEKTFQHGPFKVINKHGYTQAEYDEPLRTLDAASAELKKAGFGSVLYGDILLVTDKSGHYAGMYRNSSDDVLLNVEARNRFDAVYTLVHEFGHRYWYKVMSSGQRDAYVDAYAAGKGLTVEDREDMFQALVQTKFGPRMAIRYLRNPALGKVLPDYFKETIGGTGMTGEYLERAHSRGEEWVYRNFVRPRLRYYLLDKNPPETVTDYARTNEKEDFAETFAHYVLGKPIPPPVMERFKPTV